jgi:short subunit dehydrogenase-like uncharacterized protein
VNGVPAPRSGPIAVHGATGFTGRQVARELQGAGHELILAGRREPVLKELAQSLGGAPEVRVATPERPATLEAALAGAAVVVNCAGPFAWLGEPVVRAAIQQGVHYLDTTGEQAWMARMQETWGEAARAAGVVAVLAHAFEYAIGECAARIALEETPGAWKLEVWNRVDSPSASRGTMKSALDVLGRPCLAFVEGRRREEPVGARRAAVHFPHERRARTGVSYPGGEVLSAPGLAPTLREVRTYLVVPDAVARVLPLAARLARPLVRGGLPRWLERRIDARPAGPSPEDARQPWWVQARALAPGGRGARVTVSGLDPYGITAAIAAQGVARLLDGRAERCGVLTTGAAFEPRALLADLAPRGVAWRLDAEREERP